MAELLGFGQKFDEINVPIHQSLTAHLDYVKKRDIRQGSVKLGQMRAGAPSEQIITMPFLKEKMTEFGSGEFEVSGICNPWHLFDPSLLASPTVTIRREAIEEIKATFLQKKPHGIPQEFRILCSWDGRQKLTVRPSIGPENIHFVNLFEMMSGMFFSEVILVCFALLLDLFKFPRCSLTCFRMFRHRPSGGRMTRCGWHSLSASAVRADKVRKMSGFRAPCQCR